MTNKWLVSSNILDFIGTHAQLSLMRLIQCCNEFDLFICLFHLIIMSKVNSLSDIFSFILVGKKLMKMKTYPSHTEYHRIWHLDVRQERICCCYVFLICHQMLSHRQGLLKIKMI